MQPVVRHINSEGPSRAVNVFALAGHVTVDAISLSLYGHEAGSTDDLTVPKPRYAQILDPGQPLPHQNMHQHRFVVEVSEAEAGSQRRPGWEGLFKSTACF